MPQRSRLKNVAPAFGWTKNSEEIAVIAQLSVRSARRWNDAPALGTPNYLLNLHL
jgi:hypothetical protein